ncbi:MAG: hypothetical protein NT003_03325 [Candidatus Magasanikbacteria bacterium]|nr:hypothetical protein [Candidatus Magasanikbacteria bacterium]
MGPGSTPLPAVRINRVIIEFFSPHGQQFAPFSSVLPHLARERMPREGWAYRIGQVGFMDPIPFLCDLLSEPDWCMVAATRSIGRQIVDPRYAAYFAAFDFARAADLQQTPDEFALAKQALLLIAANGPWVPRVFRDPVFDIAGKRIPNLYNIRIFFAPPRAKQQDIVVPDGEKRPVLRIVDGQIWVMCDW